MDTEKLIVGRCPVCGGDVVKTMKGFACANSLTDSPTCKFFMFSTVGNRRLSDSEVLKFLDEKKLLLDGFSTKDGKTFTSILSFGPDGAVNMSSQIGTCPKCGGVLYIGPKAISCGNFRHPDNPCQFTVWRNVGGHDFSLSELLEICNIGTTSEAVPTYNEKGDCSLHKFALSPEKDKIVWV